MKALVAFFVLPAVLAINYSPKFLGNFVITEGPESIGNKVTLAKGRSDQELKLSLKGQSVLVVFDGKTPADPEKLIFKGTLKSETVFEFEWRKESGTYEINEDTLTLLVHSAKGDKKFVAKRDK